MAIARIELRRPGREARRIVVIAAADRAQRALVGALTRARRRAERTPYLPARRTGNHPSRSAACADRRVGGRVAVVARASEDRRFNSRLRDRGITADARVGHHVEARLDHIAPLTNGFGFVAAAQAPPLHSCAADRDRNHALLLLGRVVDRTSGPRGVAPLISLPILRCRPGRWRRWHLPGIHAGRGSAHRSM